METRSPRKKRRREICVTWENWNQLKKILSRSLWSLVNVTGSPQIDEETTTVERNEDENKSRVEFSTRSEDGSTSPRKKWRGEICVVQDKRKQIKKILGRSLWSLVNVTSSPQIDEKTTTVERNGEENDSRF